MTFFTGLVADGGRELVTGLVTCFTVSVTPVIGELGVVGELGTLGELPPPLVELPGVDTPEPGAVATLPPPVPPEKPPEGALEGALGPVAAVPPPEAAPPALALKTLVCPATARERAPRATKAAR